MEKSEAVSRMRAGDPEGFAEIVRQFQTAIVRYLYRLTGDEELARDLAQDTFVQAYESLARMRPDLSFKAWLYRIATNNALQHHRRKALVSFIALDEGQRRNTGGDIADKVTERAAVHEALLKVPQKLRVCMVLHIIDGFKHREIAEMLGISEDAVRMRVARGSEEFRKLYSASGGDGR